MIGTSKPNCDGLGRGSVGSRLWPGSSRLEANHETTFVKAMATGHGMRPYGWAPFSGLGRPGLVLLPLLSPPTLANLW